MSAPDPAHADSLLQASVSDSAQMSFSELGGGWPCLSESSGQLCSLRLPFTFTGRGPPTGIPESFMYHQAAEGSTSVPTSPGAYPPSTTCARPPQELPPEVPAMQEVLRRHGSCNIAVQADLYPRLIWMAWSQQVSLSGLKQDKPQAASAVARNL